MERERNKIKLKVRAKKLSGVDRYLSIVLKVIGFLFIAIAGYYFIDAQGGDLIAKIIPFFSSTEIIVSTGEAIFPWKAFSDILISHFIGISGLIWAMYYSKKHPNKAYRFILISIIAMTFFNTIIYFYLLFNGLFSYFNYYIASVFLTITLIPFFISYLIYKKQALLSAILVYFHVFMFEMLAQWVENRYLYIFSAVSIFTIVLFYISKRDKPYLSTFINGVFAYGFLMILVLKKFVFNTNTTFLSLFFIISLLYFVIFYCLF
jgi:hypothetical protein